MKEAPRKTRSGMLEAGLVAATLITPFAAEKVEAAEMKHGAEWSVGLAEARADVFNAPVEKSRFFNIRSKPDQYGSAYWLGSHAGTRGTVSIGAEGRALLEAGIKEGTVDVVCYSHTHPPLSGEDLTAEDAAKIKEQYRAGQEVTFSWPPSQQDTSGFKYRMQKLSESGNVPLYFESVMDASGMWYYRLLQEIDRREHAERMQILEARQKVSEEWEKEVEKRILALSPDQMSKLFEEAKDDWEFFIKDLDQDMRMHYARMPQWIILRRLLQENAEALIQGIFPDEAGIELHERYQNEYKVPDDKDAKHLQRTVRNYMRTSVHADPGRDAYEGLRDAYLRTGFVVRFVSYADAAKEPPCAGPDYKAE